MSTTTPLPGGSITDTSGGRRLGLVARCAPGDAGTLVSVLDGAGGGCELALADLPDRQAASRLLSSFRRLAWARLELGPDGPRGSVNGVRHRLPVTLEVSVSAVLALAGRGVPTLVVAA